MERIRRFWRKQREKANTKMDVRYAKDAEEILTQIMVSRETTIARGTELASNVVQDYNGELFREQVRQLGKDAAERIAKRGSRTSQELIQRTLATIHNPKIRLDVEKNALIAARKVWEEEMQKPDLPYATVSKGRERLLQINQKIAEISEQLEETKNDYDK